MRRSMWLGLVAALLVATIGETATAQGASRRDTASGGRAQQRVLQPDTLPLIFTVSGGISRGSYQGGLNWALVEIARRSTYDAAFRDMIDTLSRNPRSLPRLFLTAAGGASAGNINGLLSALEWCREGGASAPHESPFWQAWVWTGWDQLTWNRHRVNNDEHGLFDRRFFKDVLLPALRAQVTAKDRFRMNCTVPVGVTVTRVRPDTIAVATGIDASSQRFAIPFIVSTDSNRVLHLQQPPRLVLDDPTLGEVVVLADTAWTGERRPDLPLSSVFRAVEASSAYPLAFGPRSLAYHKAADTRVDGACTSSGEAWRCDSARPGQFMDGGVFDNNPLGLAYGLHRCVPYGSRDARTGRGSVRMYGEGSDTVNVCVAPPESTTMVYMDPDARRDHIGRTIPFPLDDTPARGLSAVTTLIGGAIGTARGYELAVFNRTIKLLPNGHLLRVVATDRFQSIVGDQFNSFGAFVGRPFREYDFYVGVYDAIRFAAAEWMCAPGMRAGRQLERGTADCVRRILAAAPCKKVFERLDTTGRAVLAMLYKLEFGGVVTCADGSFAADTAAADPVTKARIAVLWQIANASEAIRRKSTDASPSGSDPFGCEGREFLEERVCASGFGILLDSLEGRTVKGAFRTLDGNGCARVWRDDPASFDFDNCHSDLTLPRFVDDRIRAADSLTRSILQRLSLVEDDRAHERKVEAAELAYYVGREANRDGLVWLPSSIPSRECARSDRNWVMKRLGIQCLTALETPTRLLPYHVSTALGNRSVITGYRPTWYLPKRIQIVFPAEYSTSLRHLLHPAGGYDPARVNTFSGGVGPGFAFGSKWITNVQAVGFYSVPTSLDNAGPARRRVGGEASVTALFGRFRLGYRIIPSHDRGELRGRRYNPESGSVVLGLSDVNGLAYWIMRLIK
jgi:hypothetical protein